MAIVSQPGAKTLLSVLATAAAVLAGLLILVTPLSTGFFIDAPPRGADAMGLVVLLIASLLAVLLWLGACGLLLLNGRLEGWGWLGGWRAFVAAAFAGVAAIGVLIGWADAAGWWIVPLGLFCGLLAPLAVCALLAVAGWMQPAAAKRRAWMRGAKLIVVLSALCGVAMSGYGIHSELRARARAEQIVDMTGFGP